MMHTTAGKTIRRFPYQARISSTGDFFTEKSANELLMTLYVLIDENARPVLAKYVVKANSHLFRDMSVYMPELILCGRPGADL